MTDYEVLKRMMEDGLLVPLKSSRRMVDGHLLDAIITESKRYYERKEELLANGFSKDDVDVLDYKFGLTVNEFLTMSYYTLRNCLSIYRMHQMCCCEKKRSDIHEV